MDNKRRGHVAQILLSRPPIPENALRTRYHNRIIPDSHSAALALLYSRPGKPTRFKWIVESRQIQRVAGICIC